MSSFIENAESTFKKSSEFLLNQVKGHEELNLSFSGESTDYLRWNQSKIRQSTHVDQAYLNLQFQDQGRKITFETALTQNWNQDQETLSHLLQRAREEIKVLPADPFIVALENRGSSKKHHEGHLPSHQQAIEEISDLTKDVDFVGLFASGPVIKASANSRGQKHWFSTENFFMDFSLFTKNVDGENKAVKGVYADSNWSKEKFKLQLMNAKNQISLLRKKSTAMKPGSYKVYLAPGATAEICNIISWNAMSYSAYKNGNSAFAKLADGKVTLSPKLTLKENFRLGMAPQFNANGEMAPDELSLIENGQLKNMLVSERASREYGVPSNGAEFHSFGYEPLRSPEIIGGSLKESDVLKELGTGVYLSNLHYLNWSEVAQARVTGMTRYACFWVERGEIVGPIQDMRFDVSLFDLLGADLQDLTVEQHVDPAVSTYFAREVGGKKVPGILANNFKFTL